MVELLGDSEIITSRTPPHPLKMFLKPQEGTVDIPNSESTLELGKVSILSSESALELEVGKANILSSESAIGHLGRGDRTIVW